MDHKQFIIFYNQRKMGMHPLSSDIYIYNKHCVYNTQVYLLIFHLEYHAPPNPQPPQTLRIAQ